MVQNTARGPHLGTRLPKEQQASDECAGIDQHRRQDLRMRPRQTRQPCLHPM
jgi:hypothetical protein